MGMVQHTMQKQIAAHYNILKHNATHCNTLQHTLKNIATHM